MNKLEKNQKIELRIFALCLILGSILGFLLRWNALFFVIAVASALFILTIIVLKVPYKYIVFLNIILLCVVRFEPSPVEYLFPFLLFLGLINQELPLRKIRDQIFVFALFSIYMIINFIGIMNMIDIFWGIRYFMITVYLIILAIFFFLYSHEKTFVNILRAYVISTIISAALGFLGYIGYFSNILMYDHYRIQGLFKDPNVFGPFLIPSIIILIDDLKPRKILGGHWTLYIFSIVLITFGAVFSFSRAAWVNLASCLLIYFLINIKRYPIKKTIIILAILSLCASFTWFYVFDDSLQDFFYERSSLQGYDTGRFTAQKIGLSLATDRFFGYGPGQYELVVSEEMGEGLSAHNLYIRLILENGIIGFILFMTVIFYIMLRLFQLHCQERRDVGVKSAVLFSILAGILVNSLVIDTLHWRHLWFFIGVSLSMINERKECLCRGEYYGDRNHSRDRKLKRISRAMARNIRKTK